MWWTEGDGPVVCLIIHVDAVLIDLDPCRMIIFFMLPPAASNPSSQMFVLYPESPLLYICNNIMKKPTPHHVEPHKGDTLQVAITLIAAISLLPPFSPLMKSYRSWNCGSSDKTIKFTQQQCKSRKSLWSMQQNVMMYNQASCFVASENSDQTEFRGSHTDYYLCLNVWMCLSVQLFVPENLLLLDHTHTMFSMQPAIFLLVSSPLLLAHARPSLQIRNDSYALALYKKS